MSLETPTTIKFTDEDILKATAKEMLTLGWFALGVQDAQRQVGNEGTKVYGMLSINMMCQALEDPEDPESGVGPTQYVSIPLPMVHPEAEGAVVPDWSTGLCCQAIQALFGDELPSRPEYHKATKQYFLDGEEITREEAEEAYTNNTEACLVKAEEVWADPSQLINYVFFGENQLDKKTKQYRNIRNLKPTLPDNATLVPVGSFVERIGGTAARPKKGNGSKGRAKPAKKRRK